MTFIDEDYCQDCQEWFNPSHLVEGKNVSHYHLVDLENNDYMKKCYLKVDMNSKLDESTDYVYSEMQSTLGGVGATIESILGIILNLLVIVALVENPYIRKQYLTPAIVSLATTDLLYSFITLPMQAHNYFSR